MPTILPRLRNLLAMLAREPEPLPVREVADRLRVSRRTVFRELANVDSVIGPYGLEVGSRPGEGVTLEGPDTAKTALLRDLEKLDRSGPADRQDRQDRLVLAIIQAPGNKLAAYADRFRVSAPTISHDLDDIEPWLAERGLRLRRKPGSGISVDGEETAIRRTVLTLMGRMAETAPYPHPDILLDIIDLAPDLDPILGWMTPQSLEAFQNYLAVMVQRLMDGHQLDDNAAATRYDEFTDDARRLATVLAEAFNITVGPVETAALSVELAACRPNNPRTGPDREDDGLAAVATEMIDRFDPARAPLLRLDEILLDGLAAHLRTAVVRLRHGIETVDPMRAEIAATYPDIMDRCRAACDVLRRYGDRLPEDEVSLVAAHFGAALLRLREEGTRRRTVRIGIICVHGIGSSYLLASQVKQAFSTRVLVEVGWHGDRDNWHRYDLLVSTTPLNYDNAAAVVVPPILGPDDLRRLEDELSALQVESVIRDQAPGTFVENVRQLEDLARQVRVMVESFAIAAVPPGVDFGELADAAGRLFSSGAGEAISRDLVKREAVATQVIPELRLILLHCRTDGVGTPLFGIVRPAGESYTDPAFLGARAATVMLLPPDASREAAELMGCLSSGLIQEEGFLEAVRSGDGEAVGEAVRRILGAALFQFSMQKLKG